MSSVRGDAGSQYAVRFAVIICALLAPALRAGQSPPAATSTEFFKSGVRPVLAANCYDCHTDLRSGGLRLDSREAMLKGGRSGAAIVPGDPDKRLLVEAVRQTNDKLKMPKGGRLKPEDVETLVEWIRAGAVWPSVALANPDAAKESKPATDVSSASKPRPPAYVITPEQRAFWSFQPIRKPPVPAVSHGDWPKTRSERFRCPRL